MRRVVLGRSGIEVSQLAIGTGTQGHLHSSNQVRKLGPRLPDLLQHAFDRGITLFDTADQYGTHAAVGEAARRIGRDRVVLLTKSMAHTPWGMQRDLDRFRRELNTDYIDIVLLHCMLHPWWNRVLRPVMNVLSEAKARGVVRAVGVSNHNFGALQTSLADPWPDLVMVRYNPLGYAMEARPERVLPVMRSLHAQGKGVYGMKVMAIGRLPAQQAIRYQLDAGCIDAFVIGMESIDEVDENVRVLEELAPLPV